MITRSELLTALAARLEQADEEVRERAHTFFCEKEAPARERARLEALAELWRRDKLRTLRQEIVANVKTTEEGCVMLFALDVVTPENVPSFREWLEEHARASLGESHGIPPR